MFRVLCGAERLLRRRFAFTFAPIAVKKSSLQTRCATWRRFGPRKWPDAAHRSHQSNNALCGLR